jgi:hypothetical protein
MLEAFILALLILNPRHELNRDPELLTKVATYAIEAGNKYDIEPSLIIYWAYRESSLKIDAVGKLGEVGYCQAHGKAKKTCIAAGCDVVTRSGGLHCIALLLDMGRRYCGSLERGAVWYACGNCRGTEKTRKKIKQRLKEWKRRWEKSNENIHPNESIIYGWNYYCSYSCESDYVRVTTHEVDQ